MNEILEINPLFQAGLEFQAMFKREKWSFCFIGGLAVIRWGEIRITQDIYLCLKCGFGNEDKYVKRLLAVFKSRINNAHQFALENRISLLYASNGISVDISLSGLPFEEEMIKRSTPFSFHPGCSLLTCSAEDLIVLKAFADRTRDWMDIESIIVRNRDILDSNYIIKQLAPLSEVKDSPQIIEKLRGLLKNQ